MRSVLCFLENIKAIRLGLELSTPAFCGVHILRLFEYGDSMVWDYGGRRLVWYDMLGAEGVIRILRYMPMGYMYISISTYII